MKKILLLLAVVLGGVNSAGAEEEITFNFNSWGSNCVLSEKTITFNAQWAGGSQWIGETDGSEKDYFVVEFQEPTVGELQLALQGEREGGGDLVSGTTVSLENGSLIVGIPCKSDESFVAYSKARVKQAVFQSKVASAKCVVKKIYWATAEEYATALAANPQPFHSVFTGFGGTDNSDESKTFSPTKAYDWFQTYLGTYDASKFDYFILELSSASETNVVVKVQANGDPETEVSGTIKAGDTFIKISLNPATKSSIKQVVMQNVTQEEFTVKAAYFATQAYAYEAQPDKLPLSLTNVNGGWDATYDASSKTISINAENGGGKGWYFGNPGADYSGYENLVLEVNATTNLGSAVIQYNGGVSQSVVGFGIGADKIVVPLKAEGIADVLQIYIQGGNGCTYTLVDAYIAKSNVTPSAELGTYAITPSKEKVSFSRTDYALDFTSSELKAYVVSAVTATEATLAAIDKVPANTGILLFGTAGHTYNIPVITTADAPAANKLKPGNVDVAANSVYVLSDGQFKLFTGTNIPWGKAYLTDVPAGARELNLDIEGLSTGIFQVEDVKVKKDNVYYDLSGRRVLYPTKGLYVVNGKKIIVK